MALTATKLWPAFAVTIAGGVLLSTLLAFYFVPAAYHDDPQATRQSVRRLLDLDFSILCLSHGTPMTGNPKAILRRVLEAHAADKHLPRVQLGTS